MALSAIGSLEMRDRGERLFKEMRLMRLREVREQERLLSAQKCVQYRDKLNDHKLVKRDNAVAAKKKSMEQAHNALLYSWQKSLVDSGNAQREARESARETVVRLRDGKSGAVEKRAKSMERQRSALEQIEAVKENKLVEAAERAKRILIRHELIISDREDAKAKAEARKARQEAEERRALSSLNANGEPEVVEQPVADRGSVAAQQKPVVVVQARVVRETTRSDMKAVSNRAVEEENVVVKRLFKRCVDELRNKTKALARARMARKTTTVVQNVEFLETEFGALLALDRHPQRQYRVKSSVTLPPAEEGPVIVQTFEKVFLSDPAKDDDDKKPGANYGNDESEPDEEDDEDEEVEEVEWDDETLYPRPPLRRPRESAESLAAVATAAASALAPPQPQKRDKSAAPVKERKLVKSVQSKKPIVSSSEEQQPAGSAEETDLAAATVRVTIPAPAHASADGLEAASASWLPTPKWETVAGATAGYGLRDSASVAEGGGAFFLDEEDEELASVAPTASPSGPALNDSIESLGLAGGGGESADDLLGYDDVEVTRGSSAFSPMRTIRQYTSPARLSLKEHSGLLSVPQLHVSISSEPEDEFVAAGNVAVDASWYEFVHRQKSCNLSPDLSCASTFVARHDLATCEIDEALPAEEDGYDRFNETTLSASLSDSPLAYDYIATEQPLTANSSASLASASPSASVSASVSGSPSTRPSKSIEDFVGEAFALDSPSRKSSSFHSSVPPSTSYSSSAAARTPASPASITVRLQSETAQSVNPGQSVSFESLFIEDSEEDDDDGDDDNNDDDDNGVEEEEEEDDDGDDFEGEGSSAYLPEPSNESATFGMTFSAHNNSYMESPASSMDEEDFEMYTPRPFPPQSEHHGLGTFSRRPFKLVPSPTSAVPNVVENDNDNQHGLGNVDDDDDDDDDADNDGPALTDLLGISGGQASFQDETADSMSSTSDLNMSDVLGLKRESLWEKASLSSQEEESYADAAQQNDEDGGVDREEQAAGSRIEQEIAEMRARLLEAVQKTLSVTQALSSSRAASATSPSGSSPFFSFHNKTGADLSHSDESSTGGDAATPTATSDLDFLGISQHSLLSNSQLSGGPLSSSGGQLSGGPLSSGEQSSLSTFSLDL